MRRSTLLTQVLAVNALLVGVTALIAAIVARDRLSDVASGDGMLVLLLTVASAILLNSLLLRARLEPMHRLVTAMTDVDLTRPGMRAATPRRSAREVHVLTDAFHTSGTNSTTEMMTGSGTSVANAVDASKRICDTVHITYGMFNPAQPTPGAAVNVAISAVQRVRSRGAPVIEHW